jgi:hypothetical protein
MHETFDKHNSQQKAQQMLQNVSNPVVCESCGKELDIRSDASNVMFVCQVGSPGNAALPPFQCDSIEHWACSPKCWKIIAHACIDQHMYATLIEVQKALKERTEKYVDSIDKV